METAEPDPIPIPRAYAHLLVALIVAGAFFEAVIFAGRPWSGGAWSLAWLPKWGWDLRQDTLPTLLGYFAAALVLYGISFGGQSTFAGVGDRTRVRRSVGALGGLLAMCAAALGVFAVAAAIEHPSRLPALVVVIPMTAICWLLGVESSRFVVPRHGRQLELAEAQLTLTRERIDRLPVTVSTLRSGLIAFAARVVALASAGGVAASLERPSLALAGVLITVGFTATALVMYGIGASGMVVEQSRAKRVATIAGAYGLYALLVLLGVVNLIAVAPHGWPVALPLLIAELLVPIGFRTGSVLSARAPWRQRVSLRGALVAFKSASLVRTERQLVGRVEALRRRRDAGETVPRAPETGSTASSSP